MKRPAELLALVAVVAAASLVATVARGAARGDVTLRVAATPHDVSPGARVSFTVRVDDRRLRPTLRLRQTVPAGLTRLRYRSATGVSVAGRAVTLRLRRGAGSFTVAGTVAPTARGTLAYAVAGAGTTARALARVAAPATTTAVTTTKPAITTDYPPPPPPAAIEGTAADLSVTVTSAQAGQVLNVVVRNDGPGTTPFTVDFAFGNTVGPAGSTDSGTYANGVWKGGSLGPTRIASLAIFTPRTGGRASVTAKVTALLPDPQPANDAVSLSF